MSTGRKFSCDKEPSERLSGASKYAERSPKSQQELCSHKTHGQSRRRMHGGEWRERKKKASDRASPGNWVCKTRKQSNYAVNGLPGKRWEQKKQKRSFQRQGAATQRRLRQVGRCRYSRDKMESRSGPRGQGGSSRGFTSQILPRVVLLQAANRAPYFSYKENRAAAFVSAATPRKSVVNTGV